MSDNGAGCGKIIMRWVYKYPHRAYPYDELVRVNGQRNRLQPEYELLDTGIFNDNRYFDITAGVST